MIYIRRIGMDLNTIKSFINYPFSEEGSKPEFTEKVVKFSVDRLQSHGFVLISVVARNTQQDRHLVEVSTTFKFNDTV